MHCTRPTRRDPRSAAVGERSSITGGTMLTLRRITSIVLIALALVDAGMSAARPAIAAGAMIIVTSLDDAVNADGNCSLREAITAANTNTPVDGCAAGSATDGDTII